MESNRNTEIYIDGRVYTLNGFEEAEYLQSVAAYINDKIGELKKDRAYSRLNADYQAVLLAMNLADDIFQARRQVKGTDRKLEAQEKETYQLRHDLVNAQLRIKALEDELHQAAEERAALEARLTEEKSQLEARLTEEKSQLEARLTEEKSQLEARLEEARQQLDQTDAERTEREKELATARKKITQLEEYKYRR